MQQTAHRSSLGASPRRPSIGTPLSRGGVPVPLQGINSRVQDTGYLLAHFGHGAPASTESRNIPRPYGFHGVNSRVQDTGYLLSHYGHGAPASTPQRPPAQLSPLHSSVMGGVARAGFAGAALAGLKHGLGLGNASWLTQGLVLAAGAEFVNRMMNPASMETAEREAKIQELERKLDNPFKGSGVVGHDQYLVLEAPPPDGLRGTSTVGAALTTASVISKGAMASGTSLASSSTWLDAAGGPIGLAVAGTTVALSYLLSRQRPARKVATTQVVDEVEPLLQQNLTGYMNGPRTQTSQAQALENFEAGWQFVVDNCDIPEMGQPGKWCVNDRKRGGQWDWFKRYRDPIANDMAVVADPAPDVQTMIDPNTGERVYVEDPGSLGNMMPLIVALGIGAVALMMGGDSGGGRRRK